MENIKILGANDALELKDAFNKLSGKMGGVVEIRDGDTDEVLLKKKPNLFVQRGRAFGLELLFNETVPADTGYIRNLNRTINHYRVGNAGTPDDQLFTPIPPNPQDMDLANKVPFRVVDLNDPDTFLSTDEEEMYHEMVVKNGVKYYFGKSFESGEVPFVVDKANNEIYRILTLKIDVNDCRGEHINELGLCISADDHTSSELFSRITFDSESFKNVKTLKILYYIYA